MYKLDLPAKIKIYLVQHVMILEPAKGEVEPPVYKIDTYKGQEEDKWDVQKVISHKDINRHKWYKVKWIGYNETTWEPKGNLKNTIKKVEEYYKKVNQVKKKRTD